jgi:hypothetical protein
VGSWWQRNIIEPDKLPLLLLFLAFVVTFLVTRTITRLIRAGRGPFRDIDAGGVHIHHSIPGIVLLITGAVVAVGGDSDRVVDIAAVAIGIGASLVLDEFALILHLDDEYWTEEGRISVHAVALVTACLALWLAGFNPAGVNQVDPKELGFRVSIEGFLIFTVPAAVICVTKGKYRLALLSVFFPPIALVGAIRLARPGSSWARHRYEREPLQRERAIERANGFDARWGRWGRDVGDLIAGCPTPDATPTATSTPNATSTARSADPRG